MSEIEQFDGDIFWNEADTENNVDDPEEELENVGCGEVVEFEQAKRLSNFFGATIHDAATGEYVSRFFTTKEEAESFVESVAGKVGK